MKKRKEVALIDIFYRCWLLGILLVPPNPDVPIRVKTATPHDESWSWAKGFRIGDETPKSDDQIGLFDSFGAPVREAKRSALAYLARRFHTEHSVVYPLLLGHVNQYQRDGRFGHYTESPVVPNFEVPSTSSQRLEDDLSVEVSTMYFND